MNTRFKKIIALIPILIALLLLAGAVGCQSKKPTATETSRNQNPLAELKPTARTNFLKAKLGALDEVLVPADNPLSTEKVELGKQLFFDPRLGGDAKTSCASCHQPDKAWSDGRSHSTGVRNRRGLRNTPTLLNVGYYKTFYWDGRVSSLEEQALKALANPEEMASSPQSAVKTVSSIAGYRPLFNAAFGREEVTADRIAQAIASFERTLVTGPSPFDRFFEGDPTALTPEQKDGMQLFLTRAECVLCHETQFFTNQEFKPAGIYIPPDFGRYNWTKKDYDYGKFRTPSLRNVALTAPYFHNGSARTLSEAAFFRCFGRTRKQMEKQGLQTHMFNKYFTDDEISQMAAFLESLSGELPKVEVPQELPK